MGNVYLLLVLVVFFFFFFIDGQDDVESTIP